MRPDEDHEIMAGVPEEPDYQSKRLHAYPAIRDQLDMIYKDLANGTTTFVDAIQAIKDEFPKE